MQRYIGLYNGQTGDGLVQIGLVTSLGGERLIRHQANPVLRVGAPGTWDDQHVHSACLLHDGSQYVTYYSGYDGTKYQIGRATSPDGITWTKDAANPLIQPGSAGAFDGAGMNFPTVVYDPSLSPAWKMWYTGWESGGPTTIGFADSVDGITWVKRGQVLDVGAPGTFEDEGLATGPAILVDGTWYVHYSGQATSGGPTSDYRAGYATATDPAVAATYTKQGVLPEFSGNLVIGGVTYRSNQLRSLLRRGNAYVAWGVAFQPIDDSFEEVAFVVEADSPTSFGTPTAALPLRDNSWDTVSAENPSIIAVDPPRTGTIEAWVTTAANVRIADLERVHPSPIREMAFSPTRNLPGTGTLEYHLESELLAAYPTLFEPGNLVHMRFRGRTFTWIIEDEVVVLDEKEDATAWVRIAGPGALQLVGDRSVFPTDFDEGANLDPSTWASQWRSFVNRAAGEMLWDLIDESNPRFATQIERGTVETTGSDGWTQDLRFNNLLEDVVAPVTAAHGDVGMDGLTFHYWNAQGSDRSQEVIFEEGADLIRLKRDRTDRDRISYLIGEGVGEGVFAKLRVASRADARRIEAFAALKEATNESLLQTLTTAALDEHPRRETVSFDVDESRFWAFWDFDVGDTVRAIAPSRGIDVTVRIDAIYVAEDDNDQVRVAVDLAGLREDELLKLQSQQARTRTELGVRNRQPQGQLTFCNFNGNGVFDSDEPAVIDFLISDRIYVTIEAESLFAFSEFWAPATAAASGGTSTSASGGTSTSDAGGGSTPTSDSEGAHRHTMFVWNDNTDGGTFRKFTAETASGGGSTVTAHIKTTGAAGLRTGAQETAHSHTVTIAAHDHDIDPHDHDIDPHDHDLTYGVYKEALPVSHSVTVGVYKLVAAVWTLVVSLSGLTDLTETLDLSAYIDGPGSWRLEIQSAAAQPNNGRLAVSVSGAVTGAIKSA